MRNALRNLFKDAWNVPNALTVLRLILVPVFIYLYMNDQRWPAVAVFAVASLPTCWTARSHADTT